MPLSRSFRGRIRHGGIAHDLIAATHSDCRGCWRSLASVCGACAAQEPAASGRVVGAPREDLIEFEDVVETVLAASRTNDWLAEFNILAFGHGDPDGARRRLESRLKSRIEQIDRVCKLTPEQRNKLNVAGRGDIKRAFARIE